jgi:hypothetical protein
LAIDDHGAWFGRIPEGTPPGGVTGQASGTTGRAGPTGKLSIERAEGDVAQQSAGRTAVPMFRPRWGNPFLAEPYEIRGSAIHIPDRPGAGIAWDEAAVKRFSI